MGNIFSINIEGTEKNYNANLENYKLTHCDKLGLDFLFNGISIKDGYNGSKIGSFYHATNNQSKDLELLWHSFCYKHKLIINKIRFESYQVLYHPKFNMKYEIGFNALWNTGNNEKIPMQVFKKEKSNSSKQHIHSSWYIYIGLKTIKQRKMDMIEHINNEYNLCQNTNDEPWNEEIMNILCSYLPSNHILNYSQRRTFKLCKFSLDHNNEERQANNGQNQNESILNEINDLISRKSEFMKLFEINAIKLLMFDYNIKSHEILQFTRYLLLFFHHFYVLKWIKSKCNYHSKQGKFMNNALNEVMKIWSKQNIQKEDNKRIRVK